MFINFQVSLWWHGGHGEALQDGGQKINWQIKHYNSKTVANKICNTELNMHILT